MSIYDIPSIVANAMPLALTPANIQAGFRKTGICPFNRNLFNDIDFAPSYVTDRPNPNDTNHNTVAVGVNPTPEDDNPTPAVSPSILQDTAVVEVNPIPEDDNPTPAVSPSIFQDEVTAVLSLNPAICENVDIANYGTVSPKPSTSSGIFSPESVRPYPKAPPRLTTNKGRKKRKSTIYTDTPEKETIRKETEEKERKKKAKGAKLNLNKKRLNSKSKNINKAMTNKKKTTSSDDDEDEEYYCLVCMESYGSSRPGDDWVQCLGCRMWAHEACTAGDFTYLCHNCESD
ncbi:hypothetical protein PYW07_000442 [Mythimna separata]|uniref:Zinc finger PHD-type domain-containing protein n=1 Tax=Mythimna separata TaxID=271217 RepID=A0AAD8E0J5_MYTSE|nr:hypothetical protein PYW07_000442 [Mythimna separata]